MKNTIGIYFSGTGNTKHCVETFVNQYDKQGVSISIDDPDILTFIAAHEVIVLGYPVYFSNAPKIVQDFIHINRSYFANKKIFIIATMGLFSGDGTGCTGRALKKYGAEILGGLHLKMPDSIGDEKALKKSISENKEIVHKADQKILIAVQKLQDGSPQRDGLGFFYHIAGLFGQRLWFYRKSTSYKKKPDIDHEKCIGCGICVKLCPMQNIALENKKAISHDQCTMCYRCFSHCPTKALTILGKHVYEQCLFERYQ